MSRVTTLTSHVPPPSYGRYYRTLHNTLGGGRAALGRALALPALAGILNVLTLNPFFVVSTRARIYL